MGIIDGGQTPRVVVDVMMAVLSKRHEFNTQYETLNLTIAFPTSIDALVPSATVVIPLFTQNQGSPLGGEMHRVSTTTLDEVSCYWAGICPGCWCGGVLSHLMFLPTFNEGGVRLCEEHGGVYCAYHD